MADMGAEQTPRLRAFCSRFPPLADQRTCTKRQVCPHGHPSATGGTQAQHPA